MSWFTYLPAVSFLSNTKERNEEIRKQNAITQILNEFEKCTMTDEQKEQNVQQFGNFCSATLKEYYEKK